MKKILAGIHAVTKTRTIKDTVVVTIGLALSTLLSAAYIFLLARILGPADFGLYSTALALAVIVIDSFDLAINNSIVKFASQKKGDSNGFIKYGFFLKLFLGIGLTIAFALISQPLAELLHPQLKKPLLLASLVILANFLYRFPRSLLQAKKKFFKDSLLEVSGGFFRLTSVALFYWFFKLTALTAIFVYIFGASASFIIGAFFISWKFLSADINKKIKHDFFSFQKWLTIAFIIAAIHARIDSALLLNLKGPEITGIYQAGYRFFIPVMQFAAVLSLIFAPRFASFSNNQQIRTYLLKAAKLTLALSLLVLLIIPLAPWLIKLIFGIKYLQAVLPTQILSLGFAAFIAGSPFVSHLIYSTARTKLFFLINLIQLILIIVLDFLLIPSLGAVGAALAVSISLIIINILMAGLALAYAPQDK